MEKKFAGLIVIFSAQRKRNAECCAESFTAINSFSSFSAPNIFHFHGLTVSPSFGLSFSAQRKKNAEGSAEYIASSSTWSYGLTVLRSDGLTVSRTHGLTDSRSLRLSVFHFRRKERRTQRVAQSILLLHLLGLTVSRSDGLTDSWTSEFFDFSPFENIFH